MKNYLVPINEYHGDVKSIILEYKKYWTETFHDNIFGYLTERDSLYLCYEDGTYLKLT